MRQVGWICAAAQGIEVKDRRNKCPLNRVVKFKRRPERRRVGRLSGFGLQYALMHVEMSIASDGISIHDLEYSPMLSRSCRRLPCSLSIILVGNQIADYALVMQRCTDHRYAPRSICYGRPRTLVMG